MMTAMYWSDEPTTPCEYGTDRVKLLAIGTEQCLLMGQWYRPSPRIQLEAPKRRPGTSTIALPQELLLDTL